MHKPIWPDEAAKAEAVPPIYAPCSECSAPVKELSTNALGNIHFAQPCGHRFNMVQPEELMPPAEALRFWLVEPGHAPVDVPPHIVARFVDEACSRCEGKAVVPGLVRVRIPEGERTRRTGKFRVVSGTVVCQCAVGRARKALMHELGADHVLKAAKKKAKQAKREKRG